MKIGKLPVWDLLYISLALSTWKHTAWGYSVTFEGPPPSVDWANFVLNAQGLWTIGTLLAWFAWGGLMALTVDVAMWLVAKGIREQTSGKTPFGLWLTYAVVAVISSYTQLLYATQHSAPLAIVENNIVALQPGGWLYSLLENRLILLPLALPSMSFLYTISLRIEAALKKPVLGVVDTATGEKRYSMNEAAAYTGYSPSWVRAKALSGKLEQHKDEEGKTYFTESSLAPFRRRR